MHYQQAIYRIDPTVNPAGVEGSMRLQYGTLDHLPHETFVAETALARQCEEASPGFLRGVAEIKGSFSRDAGGKTVNSWEASACYFCLVGAVLHAAFEATGHNSMWDATMQSATVRLTNALRRRHALTGGLSDLSLSAWNDAQARQHGEVLELLDHAIAKEAAS